MSEINNFSKILLSFIMINKLPYIFNISCNLISIMFFYDNFYYEFKYNL